MNTENQVLGLIKLSDYIKAFLAKKTEDYNEDDANIELLLKRSEIENPWFTVDNQKFALQQWADLLTEEQIKNWLKNIQSPGFRREWDLFLPEIFLWSVFMM